MNPILHNNYNLSPKTLGPRAATLIEALYAQNRPIFHFQEAEKILGPRSHTAKILTLLIKKGIVNRLKGGTFRLVPFELGFEREYLGNPYVIARELLPNNKDKYYLSHGSAFDLHQMATQPQFIVYITTLKMIRPKIIQGTEFQFVHTKLNNFFGITEMWIDKNEKILVSDLERTLIDGLKQPAYCGGFSEVAKAFSIKANLIDPQKIIDYAIRLGVGAVIRRLGYLMELYHIGSRIHWEFLQKTLTSTYHVLDPALPADGHHIAKWRLLLNIPEEELLALRGT